MLALELPVCDVYMHIAITVYMHVYKYHSKLLVTLLNIIICDHHNGVRITNCHR